ncbi:hypothetical protein [Roseiconus lacunae]|uniref:Uncharacterized protein n=1 Tax=Roseiconus lacunae TaxID=2605694 RepID=A0ABT7PGU6_9BACT|nr:hypothetical protein [Roseiconus lacunae]MCD0460517.1 hypothetical protein [Roseiconus lacunae]MDM4015436.1 hypothetical protein [Roseiconus lacunae]WRQ52885.1 hypothetical protein U8335_10100 [Stieleria sp. HD01]
MTWHTPSGDRIMLGQEADLIRQSISTMVDELVSCRETDESPWEYGVTLFDELSWQQQLALLDRLARGLLEVTEDTVELTGINEAGIAAVYQNVSQQIELEIELQSVSPPEVRCQWRQAALNVYLENKVIEAGWRSDCNVHKHVALESSENSVIEDLAPDCDQVDRWQWLIECLADRILWDRDFDLVEEMIDAPPERAAAMRAALGITPGYYTAIAPDPTETQIDTLFDSLQKRTGGKPR